VKYRKPRAVNWVSFMLVGLAGLFAYLAVYLWPVYTTHSHVRGILLDHVPAFHKANLMPDSVCRQMMEDIRTSIAKRLQQAGINEKAVKIYLRRGKREIELEARLKAYARFPWPDKTFAFDISPKVVTDARPIDW
jgi:hypothetical protein